MTNLPRPAADEVPEYHRRYSDLVPDGDVLATWRRQGDSTAAAIAALGEAGAARRYAPGKWSIKQVLGHLIDGDRLFSHRALAFARGDPGALPSMDQEVWMANVDFDARSAVDLVAEFRAVRQDLLLLFASFDTAAAVRRGTASGLSFSVRGLVWVTVGHERHHRAILGERYGVTLTPA